jgi:hypothetical protein
MDGRASGEQIAATHLSIWKKWVKKEEASAPRAFYSRRIGRERGRGPVHQRQQASERLYSKYLARQSVSLPPVRIMWCAVNLGMDLGHCSFGPGPIHLNKRFSFIQTHSEL